MLKTLLITCLWLSVSACVTNPPDTMGCRNEITRGYCRTFTTKKTIIIDDAHPYVSPETNKKYTWPQLVQISVVIPPDEWAKTKAWFVNFCHQNNNCQGIGDWQSVINDIK